MENVVIYVSLEDTMPLSVSLPPYLSEAEQKGVVAGKIFGELYNTDDYSTRQFYNGYVKTEKSEELLNLIGKKVISDFGNYKPVPANALGILEFDMSQINRDKQREAQIEDDMGDGKKWYAYGVEVTINLEKALDYINDKEGTSYSLDDFTDKEKTRKKETYELCRTD